MNRRPDRRAAILLSLFAGGAAVASCNFVVGAGDYSIADGGADGTTGAGGPDGSGGADTATSPVDTGADQGIKPDGAVDSGADGHGQAVDAGDAGDAADSAMRRDAADGGDAATIRDAAPDSPDAGDTGFEASMPEAATAPDCGQAVPTTAAFASLVNTCLFATNCDPYILPDTMSDCLSNDTLESTGAAGAFACLSKISDCNGYYSCQGVRYASLNECPGFTSSCVGNVAFDCSSAVPFPGTVTNCALTNGACQTYTDTFGNTRAGCMVAPTCTVGDGGAQCSGNDIFTCVQTASPTGTIADGRSCGNAACVGAPGNARCSFSSEICSNSGTLSCSGSTLACTSGTTAANYDCTRAGGVCNASGTAGAACVSPGCSANVPCTETCDLSVGATITACVGGAKVSIDCTKFSFSGVASDSYGTCVQTSAGVAYCSPN